ncbi:hypothetical protein [Actinocatenispora rupis]|uniref:Uncharacterized protein n=1 Tax=Actinocatenispora rupis TaxID=519421 RepID=A0A8J3J6C8_9ACTN|nr:hypothetical protein [Actinocatenispora rupis]GID09393.1 hypothetical protein Aru02nite_02820 [Actinocatenispora rupis]
MTHTPWGPDPADRSPRDTDHVPPSDVTGPLPPASSPGTGHDRSPAPDAAGPGTPPSPDPTGHGTLPPGYEPAGARTGPWSDDAPWSDRTMPGGGATPGGTAAFGTASGGGAVSGGVGPGVPPSGAGVGHSESGGPVPPRDGAGYVPPTPWSTPPPGTAWSPQPTTGRGRIVPLIVIACVLVLVAGCVGGVWAYSSPDDHRTTANGAAPVHSAGSGTGLGATPGDGDRLSEKQYHDWRFRLGDVALSADKTGGRDADTCGPFERDRSMTSHGCRYGIELDYTADHDRIRFLHVILAFDTAAHAKQVDGALTEDDLVFNGKALHPKSATKAGKWTHRNTNEYIVVTVCTTSSAADVEQVDTYLHYANADEASALLWHD